MGQGRRSKKKHRRRAALARFYGFDCRGLTDEELIAYEALLPEVRLRERIEEGTASFASHDDCYQAHQIVYGDELRAIKARDQWIADEVDRRCGAGRRGQADGA